MLDRIRILIAQFAPPPRREPPAVTMLIAFGAALATIIAVTAILAHFAH